MADNIPSNTPVSLKTLMPIVGFCLGIGVLVALTYGSGYDDVPVSENRYSEARSHVETLKNDARRSLHREHWLRLADEFMDIYAKDKDWRNRPAALFRSAETLEELGKRSSAKKDYKEAVSRYEKLAQKHPDSCLADDALLRAAILRHENLKDTKGALRNLRTIRTQFAKSDMARQAAAYEQLILSPPKPAVAARTAPPADTGRQTSAPVERPTPDSVPAPVAVVPPTVVVAEPVAPPMPADTPASGMTATPTTPPPAASSTPDTPAQNAQATPAPQPQTPKTPPVATIPVKIQTYTDDIAALPSQALQATLAVLLAQDALNAQEALVAHARQAAQQAARPTAVPPPSPVTPATAQTPAVLSQPPAPQATPPAPAVPVKAAAPAVPATAQAPATLPQLPAPQETPPAPAVPVKAAAPAVPATAQTPATLLQLPAPQATPPAPAAPVKAATPAVPATAQTPAALSQPPAPQATPQTEVTRISWRTLNEEMVQVTVELNQHARWEASMRKKDAQSSPRLTLTVHDAIPAPKVKAGAKVKDSLLTRVLVAQPRQKLTTLGFDFIEARRYDTRVEFNPFRIVLTVVGSVPVKPRPDLHRLFAETVSAAPEEVSRMPRHNRVAPQLPAPQIPQAQPAAKTVRPSLRGAEEAFARNMALQLGLNVQTVYLDAGHGGRDPGTVHNDIVERELVLDIARRVGRLLTAHGLTVQYTRTDDTHVPLSARPVMANDGKADLFVSIHVNANNDASVHGIETYYLDWARNADAARVAALENATSDRTLGDMQRVMADIMLNARTSESRDLAQDIQRTCLSRLKRRGYVVHNGGVRSAPFHVLIGAGMPAILVEVGYCTHPKESARLTTAEYRHALAEGIAEGIISYKNTLQRRQSAQFTLTDTRAGAM